MAAYTYPEISYEARGIFFTKKLHKDTYPAITASTKSDLSGKAVMVTGASRGIGKATAIAYATAGASDLILVARSDLSALKPELVAAAKSAGKKEPNVLTLSMDVTDPKSVQAVMKEVEEKVGKVDVLINNAGGSDPWIPITESDEREWWATFDINLRGVYLVAKAFIPLLLKSEVKTIVNMSSIGAQTVMSGASSYQTSKLAVTRFSEFLSYEHCGDGLVAYSIHPGAVMTELSATMPEKFHSILVDTPELPADWLAFMTQERRTWMAGRYFSVNWDVEELLSREKEIVDGDKLKMRLVL